MGLKMTKAKPAGEKAAIFTQGSTLRHVINMTSTGAIGLIAIFLVDVINLYYISLLGEQELAAAVGYASTIMFFLVSVSIGFSIASTALTAKALGAEDVKGARRNAGASVFYTIVMTLLILALTYPLLSNMLDLLGATGDTKQLALEFMQISLPSLPLMALGMCMASFLRAQGDAKRAMYVTLSGGFAALFLDPLFIFWFDLGVHGAAVSIIFIRIILLSVGIYGAMVVHKLIEMPTCSELVGKIRPFSNIALPAMLTQLATPIGNAYVTASIAEFGDDAVAGWAIVGRLMPLAFAAVFALSGAVGPILSQNLGAKKYDRVNKAMWDSLYFSLGFCLVMWAVLAAFWPQIASLFQAAGDAAALVRFFCLFVAGSFIFNGALFVANAAFNNLGFPLYSTFFNWGRATLGVIPFVYYGKQWGPEGVLAGWGFGGIIFGILSVVVCFRALKKIPEREDHSSETVPHIPAANSPFTSGRGATHG